MGSLGGKTMEYILSVDNLTKIYDDIEVVSNASFKIEKGSVCGLLGPNGAGKTTLMKMIMNLVKCDGGSVNLDKNLNIRFLQDVPEFYDFYTVEEYLSFVLDIVGYKDDRESRIDEVLDLLNLNEFRYKKIKKLSRGLKQKVGIASVIIDNPDILLLDEPVSALDPIGRKEMFDMILSLKGSTTIVFSSHVLGDIERVCDHIILISKGKIILDNDLKNVSASKKTLLVEFKNQEDLLLIKEKLNYGNNISDEISNGLEINSDDIDECTKEVLKLLVKNKIVINSLGVKKDSLEEIFLREVKNNG